MTEERKTALENLIYLSECVFNGRVPDTGRAGSMDLNSLYAAAKAHSMCSVAAYALEKAGIRSEAFVQARAKAMRKTAAVEDELMQLLAQMESAGVWYLPLKGAVLKDFYPGFALREMSDIDVLFDPAGADKVREIFLGMGYTVKAFGDRIHDIYQKKPMYHFEMHRQLFGRNKGAFFRCYENVSQRLVPDGKSKYGRRFTPEDFYVFLNAHEYKHVSGSGTGLRSLADEYLYLKRMGQSLDWTYIGAELDKLGIREFEEENRRLADRIFGGEPVTNEVLEAMEHIVSSGTYGNRENKVRNGIARSGGGTAGKLRYFFSRVFMPLDEIRQTFPFVYRTKVFIPLLPAIRLVRGVLFRRKQMKTELKILFGKEKKTE